MSKYIKKFVPCISNLHEFSPKTYIYNFLYVGCFRSYIKKTEILSKSVRGNWLI